MTASLVRSSSALRRPGKHRSLVVPEERLIAQPDGTYHVRLNQTALVTQVATELVGDEPLVVPVVAEEVTIERVPVNTLVAGEAPTPYEEDGVLVIPILEEVLVVEKRLLHKENVRVTKRRIRISQPQQVTLRREVVEVERVAPGEQRAVPESELDDDRARRPPAVGGEESRQLGTTPYAIPGRRCAARANHNERVRGQAVRGCTCTAWP